MYAVYERTMAPNPSYAFLDTPADGVRAILTRPKTLLFHADFVTTNFDGVQALDIM